MLVFRAKLTLKRKVSSKPMRAFPLLLLVVTLYTAICVGQIGAQIAPHIAPQVAPNPVLPITAPPRTLMPAPGMEVPGNLAPEGLGSAAGPIPPPTALARSEKGTQTRSPETAQSAFFDASDPDIRQAYKAWTIAYMTRQIDALKENKSAFAMSGTMSVIVCWVAHILLALAVLAAAVEFIRAMQTRQKASENQELRVSLEGIALKTSMHGTLLLVLAMLFYYLFLKFVYPVTIVTT